MCQRRNFFLSGLQPASKDYMSPRTLQRFTVNDIYGKSNLPLDSTFKVAKVNSFKKHLIKNCATE